MTGPLDQAGRRASAEVEATDCQAIRSHRRAVGIIDRLLQMLAIRAHICKRNTRRVRPGVRRSENERWVTTPDLSPAVAGFCGSREV